MRGRLGYLPEERGLYQDMTILRTLTYFGVLQGMPTRQASEMARGWLDRLGLDARGTEKVKALSKGNQQKVQFVASVPASAASGPTDPAVLRLFVGLEHFDEDQATGMLTWPHSGFHVHSAVGVPEDDRAFATRRAHYCAMESAMVSGNGSVAHGSCIIGKSTNDGADALRCTSQVGVAVAGIRANIGRSAPLSARRIR